MKLHLNIWDKLLIGRTYGKIGHIFVYICIYLPFHLQSFEPWEIAETMEFSVKQWKYHREGEITLCSICNFCLLGLIFILIFYWSTNGLKPRRVSDFIIKYCWNCQREEKQERIISGQFFSFFNSWNVWKF